MKTQLEQIKESYLSKEAAINSIEEQVRKKEREISKKQEQIAKLKERIRKLDEKTWWGDDLVRPILEMIKAKFPEITWRDDEKFIPLGMMSRISVFGSYRDETVGISFIPEDLNKAGISFETDKVIEEYPEGSLGYWNGMGKERIEITDMNLVYDYIGKQINAIDSEKLTMAK